LYKEYFTDSDLLRFAMNLNVNSKKGLFSLSITISPVDGEVLFSDSFEQLIVINLFNPSEHAQEDLETRGEDWVQSICCLRMESLVERRQKCYGLLHIFLCLESRNNKEMR
jgi:hypothetical protein